MWDYEFMLDAILRIPIGVGEKEHKISFIRAKFHIETLVGETRPCNEVEELQKQP